MEDAQSLAAAGEAALKQAQLELQLSTRKQAADIELVRDGLQQQQAALVGCLQG